ncbi:threonine ammonia-lyase [Pseudokineococcus basanitobsidens]|uniref:threonine ammonia-lyase n=1 Tax=Pseudokineococcus basanitobsidens TaxID=1926649 RepID=A0ABU8RME2_9ACTN
MSPAAGVGGAAAADAAEQRPAVTVGDVEVAAELLADVVRTTPLEPSAALSELVGGPVLLKCENLQHAGSFKIRGAYTRMSRLSAAERERGVVAASAGNHAQGVALAARLLGIRSTIWMPVGAPIPKVEATKRYGAQVHQAGTTVDEALGHARAHEAETGAVLIHPFDHVDIVAGQGTVGLELLEQCPDLRTVVVCTGGGGLVAGIATAVKARAPHVRVVAAQAEGAAAWPASLDAGEPRALARMATMADGIAVGRPGDVPFGLVRDLVDDVVTVAEESLSRALLLMLERSKLVVEPAGAAAVAALLEDPGAFEPPVAVVLSGGNIDPLLLMRVIRHGMASAGRYLGCRVRVPDRPGALSGVLRVLAEADANVLEVFHTRTTSALAVDEVEIGLQLETTGHEHATAVLTALALAGVRVVD